MPSLVKLYNEFKGSGFIILAIDIREKREIVKKFADEKKLTFPVLLDADGKVAANYGIRAHPDHFLIDRQGKLIGKSIGGRDWSTTEVRNLIRFLVEQN